MWLQATITKDDLKRYLDELLPLRIDLDTAGKGDGRAIDLERPRRLEMVPDTGIRIETSAQLVWPVAGIHVPANVRSIQVLLSPRIDSEGDPALGFAVEIEKLDVSLLPGVVESAIKDVVNGELARPGLLPTWKFTRTLDFNFDVPSAMGFAGKMHLFASWADLKVTTEGLTLAMSFRAGVIRDSARVPQLDSASSLLMEGDRAGSAQLDSQLIETDT